MPRGAASRSLSRKNNLQSIIDSGGLAIGQNVLSKGPLFTTETPDEESQEELNESEFVVDESTGGVLNP